MDYQEFAELPAWSPMKAVDGKHVAIEPGKPKWSGKGDPPALGDVVRLAFNNLGKGEVVGYFVQHDYVGVIVKLQDPPEWFVKQNGGNAPGHAFGAEID